jgi:hypothetical protein
MLVYYCTELNLKYTLKNMNKIINETKEKRTIQRDSEREKKLFIGLNNWNINLYRYMN